MQRLLIVNACDVLPDDTVAATIPALQMQLDRDFLPAWIAHGAVPLKLEFMTWHEFHANEPRDAWAMFLNRHSKDDGVLGWHTQEGKRIFGRVFVGDCIRFGLSWTADLMHEVLETSADPDVRRAYRMHDGRLAAIEVCDPVEAEDQAYFIDGVLVTNFVYPAYYSNQVAGKYDFRNILRAPCPALSPGGYQQVFERGQWVDLAANRGDGMLGRRALMAGWRRRSRHNVGGPADVLDDPTLLPGAVGEVEAAGDAASPHPEDDTIRP